MKLCLRLICIIINAYNIIIFYIHRPSNSLCFCLLCAFISTLHHWRTIISPVTGNQRQSSIDDPRSTSSVFEQLRVQQLIFSFSSSPSLCALHRTSSGIRNTTVRTLVSGNWAEATLHRRHQSAILETRVETKMNRFLFILVTLCYGCTNAFSVVPTCASKEVPCKQTATHSTGRENDLTSSFGVTTASHLMKQWLASNMLTAVLVSSIGSTVLFPQSACASYSAYAHREEDWQQRVEKNAIQVSSPKLLRDQLRQIAPMNEERSRIFCPNGPSAAVTPLMENRCSDVRQATPSVFGRSDDAVGNSIPGFSKDWTSSIYSSTAADPGGLPEYGFTKSNRK